MPTPHHTYPTLQVFDHPLIQHKLTYLRDQQTSFRAFRALIAQIAGLMVYEVTRTFPSETVQIQTPIGKHRGTRITAAITVCPVLRAGLGMAEGVLDVMPEARVGHIGLFRDEKTLLPTQYLSKLPRDLETGPVILVDPMLATGGSAVKAAQMLFDQGAKDVRFLCLVAAPEGVTRFSNDFPNVPIYAGALDDRLDEHGFIIPGLGDAGDRMYGTQ